MVRTVPAVIVGLLACLPAYGDYVVTPVVRDANDLLGELTVQPGDSFELTVWLASDDANTHELADLRVRFSTAGLIYESYVWGENYTTAGLDDLSTPAAAALPLAIDADTYPGGDVDILLSNVTDLNTVFGTGGLATLNLAVPITMSEGDVVVDIPASAGVEPTFMVDTLTAPVRIDATADTAFTLHIIPEPVTLALLWGAAVACLRRRRRRG